MIGNIKGPQGPAGETGAQGKQGEKGSTGESGIRGSRWTEGTAITGTSTNATVYNETGITDSLVNDYYLNQTTGSYYRCVTSGNASAAKWIFAGNLKGPQGEQGPQGAVGATGPQGKQGPAATVDSKFDKKSSNAIENSMVTVYCNPYNSTKSQILASYTPRSTSSYDVVVAGRCMTKEMFDSCNSDIVCNTTVTVQLNDIAHNDTHMALFQLDYADGNQFLRKLHSEKPTNASSSVISSARLVVDDGEMMTGYVFELLVLTITPKAANYNDYLNVYIDNANAIEPSSTVTPAFASLYSFEGNPPMGSWTTVYDENVDLSTDYSDQWTIEAAATI